MPQAVRHHDHANHDDPGGLHRDARATGAIMGRRGLLRLAAGLGAGAAEAGL